MLFGIVVAGSSKLTEIGRALKENIALKKTVERLGWQLSGFRERDAIMDNYIECKALPRSLTAAMWQNKRTANGRPYIRISLMFEALYVGARIARPNGLRQPLFCK